MLERAFCLLIVWTVCVTVYAVVRAILRSNQQWRGIGIIWKIRRRSRD